MSNPELSRRKIREKALQSLFYRAFYEEMSKGNNEKAEEISSSELFAFEESLTEETAKDIYQDLDQKIKTRTGNYRLLLDLGFERGLNLESERVQYRVLKKLIDFKNQMLENAKVLDFSDELNQDFVIQETLAFDETHEVPEYLKTLVSGVISKQEALDQIISTHLANKWTIDRIPRVDLCILRIALFEMSEKLAPERVVINEAIELAKEFSNEQSAKFINGVLSNYYEKSTSSTN